jgi:hypothetical protein
MHATDQRLLDEMDSVDKDLGAHLLTLTGPRGRISARSGREAIVAWCRSADATARHSADLVNGTALAAETMDDESLSYLIDDLIREAATDRRETAA